jgi:hypothetical protein
MRLNGWQRLWVVFAVLTFAGTTIFVYGRQQQFVFVQGVNIVASPPDLNIQDLDTRLEKLAQELREQGKEYLPGGDVTYSEKGETFIPVSAEMAAILNASVTNDQVRKTNRNVILYGYGAWLIFIVLVYIAGWTVSWVYRGFKPNTSTLGT